MLFRSIYVTIIRPGAQIVLEEQRALQSEGVAYDMDRSFFVVIKDYEQEACFVLMLWATAIMGYKARFLLGERQLLRRPMIEVESGTRILPQDARKYSRPLQALPDHEREYLLPRALLSALQRFGSTQNIQDVSQTVREICETEAERLDSELSMIRYIAWAIPSIGFIGTVRGIGQALSLAHRAMEGDISGVTQSLGVAFNSTFVALLLSLVVMLLLHQLQLLQERLVLDSEQYCDSRLIRHMATGSEGS